MDYIKVKGLQKDEVVGLVKEWIKLYPHSFNPEVNLWFYELPDNQVIIGLHDDLSTLAVSLLVIYLTSALKDTTETENVVAYLTVDDNEILLKHAKLDGDPDVTEFSGYDDDTDQMTELVAPWPYDKMYSYWLLAASDEQNLEMDKYNSDRALFENAYDTMHDWWNRTYMPVQRNRQFRI